MHIHAKQRLIATMTPNLDDPVNNGVAFETLMDGAPEEGEPVIQKLTKNDGGVTESEEKELLMDDLHI